MFFRLPIVKFFSRLLNRATITVALVLLQAGWLLWAFSYLTTGRIWVNAELRLLSLFIVLYLVRKDEDSSYKIIWIVLIGLLPLLGGALYLMFGNKAPSKGMRRRMQSVEQAHAGDLAQQPGPARQLAGDHFSGLSRYVARYGPFPVWDKTQARYFSCGEAMYPKLLADLEKAEKFIFLEYFIVRSGKMWSGVEEILTRKAAQGVDVRLIYDGFGCLTTLPHKYYEELRAKGISCQVFNPFRPLLNIIQNNRDHRKLCIIDGWVGFTGGINLADEYINQKERFGHWKDTAIMIKGNAVKSFTVMFLQMWDLNEKNLDNIEDYVDNRPYRARGYVIPYGDNPFSDEHLGVNIYMDIINTAKNYVHICSPYLIPNNDLISALIYAAKRGVDVKIIVPGIQDKKYCRALSYTYYPQLINAGVKIYHYTPGFIHAKSIVSDDKKAMVGTQNLDFRSLFLHFECGAFFCTTSTVNDVEDDFNDTLKKSDLFELTDLKKVHLPTKAAGKLLRLVAPLL